MVISAPNSKFPQSKGQEPWKKGSKDEVIGKNLGLEMKWGFLFDS